tara:strand:- start:34 stop:333 length:300 start_codon:yes stop_codon:yes gene_type:complete
MMTHVTIGQVYPYLKQRINEMKTKVHVNQFKVKSNGKTGDREPVLTVKTYKSNTYAHEVQIEGPCRVIYSPDKPLSCGAKVWIETESEVTPIIREITND